MSYYYNCVLEKYQWVEAHFGYDWTKRVILTRDKTIVSGDILIDDKPEITGCAMPPWQHVLYDRYRITGMCRNSGLRGRTGKMF